MGKLFLLVSICFLASCSITQKISPVNLDGVGNSEICIIENPKVTMDSFLVELQTSLINEGFGTRIINKDASVGDCKLTCTYTANWGWDLLMYLKYAEINIYDQGALSGNAVYDARSGSGNMGKFISAKSKINELVSGLFLKK